LSFNREFGRGLINVQPVRGVGVPKTIAARAVTEIRRIRASGNSFERRDEVWAAFDRDEHDEVLGSLAKCEAEGVGIAFSNPCIEQWALIHFQDPVSDAPLTRHQAQGALAKFMPTYAKGGSKILDFDLMKEHYNVALKNAEILVHRRKQEGDGRAAPVTTFHLLTERIIKLGGFKK
jgi:hypothetical protein